MDSAPKLKLQEQTKNAILEYKNPFMGIDDIKRYTTLHNLVKDFNTSNFASNFI